MQPRPYSPIHHSLVPIHSVLSGYAKDFFLPICIEDENRKSINLIQLTEIGEFGIWRKERTNVPGHFHTGIDIKRPTENYIDEPIFPISNGVVISKRDDGPFAQLIIEHEINNIKFWTLYEHIAGIMVTTDDSVKSQNPIARFMNWEELNKFGWQFDHFHFEILKVKPYRLRYNPEKPDRHYSSYSLVCYTKKDLSKYFHNPIVFFTNILTW